MKYYAAFFVSLFLFLGTSIPTVRAATIQPVDGSTVVSVSVGNTQENLPSPESGVLFTITGFTSPGAHVTIQNPGIHNETNARSDGSFTFDHLFLALFREDICISAEDTDHITTTPLCIPPPGNLTTQTTIGPILLAPTAQISMGNAYIGDTVTYVGQTIPNVDVQLNTFTDEQNPNRTFALIPKAYAYAIPQLTLKSDAKGRYSLTLPTTSSQLLRMFTKAVYKGNPTPKGVTLSLDIFPLWMLLFKFFATFWALLMAHIIELILLLQAYILLMYFLHHYFSGKKLMEHRKHALAVIHGEIMVRPSYEPTVV